MQNKTYEELVSTPSDINQHLPYLMQIASMCDSVTEFGTRNVVSTYAFLKAAPKVLRCYDIVYDPQIEHIKQLSAAQGVDFKFIEASVLGVKIEKTDFLFIDTLHCYGQLKRELALHGKSAKKFIGFHDVVTFGYKDEAIYEHADKSVLHEPDRVGLLPAIFEFLQDNPHWKIHLFNQFNNGLLILRNDK